MSATVSTTNMPRLTDAQCSAFARDGFLIIRDLATGTQLQQMRQVTLEHLEGVVGPVEYEADVAYPGAPSSRDAKGGQTVRRLLQAYDRHPAFRDWACNAHAASLVGQLLNDANPYLTRCHHNCVMTKQPAFSSTTAWHQDLRYWSFAQPELINLWLALGHETPDNGCMRVIPGSHRMTIAPERLDDARFLREDRDDNRELLSHAVTAELAPGDVLLFHAGVFHAAGRNQTDERKLSAVFTYHGSDNHALPDTRSARLDPIRIASHA